MCVPTEIKGAGRGFSYQYVQKDKDHLVAMWKGLRCSGTRRIPHRSLLPWRRVEVGEEHIVLAHKKKRNCVSEVHNNNTKRMRGRGKVEAAGVDRGLRFSPEEPSTLR